MTDSLRFGYNAGLPAGTTTAWGARAIINQIDGSVDLVHDRQSAIGDDAAVNALLSKLNGGVNTAWIKRAGELLVTGELNTRVAKEITLYADQDVTVVGNTNASAGYLYVAAFPIQQGSAR
jgi:hypothetical protein